MGRTWSGGPGVPERAVRHDGVMRIRRGLAGLGWRLSPYRLVGHEPPSEPGVFLGAPHTGNWDFIALLGVAWHYGMPMKVLIKDSWVRGPAGPLIRAMGGIGVDRSRPGGLVDELVARADPADPAEPAAKIASLYASFLDEERIEELGPAPLRDELAPVLEADDEEALAAIAAVPTAAPLVPGHHLGVSAQPKRKKRRS